MKCSARRCGCCGFIKFHLRPQHCGDKSNAGVCIYMDYVYGLCHTHCNQCVHCYTRRGQICVEGLVIIYRAVDYHLDTDFYIQLKNVSLHVLEV